MSARQPDDGDLEAFRREVCEFLQHEMHPRRTQAAADVHDRTGLSESFERALQRKAGERGYLGLTIDEAHGGRGRPRPYRAMFEYEVAYHDAPLIDTAVTLASGPILAFADERQRADLLPRMLAGEIEMCIAYSESSAGNDLGAIETTATPRGDGFVLSGTKVLITGADKADHCLTVAITDPERPPQNAMTMFIVDMREPGVSVVAQPTMSTYSLWQVRFEDVWVPGDAVVGVVNEGWAQLLQALTTEQGGTYTVGWCQRLFDDVHRYSAAAPGGVDPLLDDPVVADQLVGLWIEVQGARRLALAAADRHANAATKSMAKVYSTELMQRLTRFGTEVAGLDGTVEGARFGPTGPPGLVEGRLGHEFLFRFDGSISVGANELHRTTIFRSASSTAATVTGARAAIRRHLDDHWDRQRLDSVLGTAPGYDTELWTDLLARSSIGSAGTLPVAAVDGGEPSFVTLAVLSEELGRARCPTPIQNGVVLAASVIAQVGSADDRRWHLPEVFAGRTRYAVALVGPTGRPLSADVGVEARVSGDGWRLNGVKAYVPYADSADVYLVSARPEGVDDPSVLSVFLVPADSPGLRRVSTETIGRDRQAELRFDDVAVSDSSLIGDEGGAWVGIERALPVSMVALAAEAGGASSALLEQTLTRVATREQFGGPLSRLQAVQHRGADMVLDQTLASDAVWAAVARLDAGDDAQIEAAVAKVLSAEACGRVAAAAHQLWGGTGYLAETGLHHWTRLVKGAEPVFGGARHHRRRLLTLLDERQAWSDHPL